MHHKHFEMWSSYYLKIIFVAEIRSLTLCTHYSQAEHPDGVLLLRHSVTYP